MPLVKVNLSPVAAAMLRVMPKRSDRTAIMRQLGAAAMQFWKKQAQGGLRSSGRDYLAGLQHKAGPEKVTIVLSGRVPNMIENGWAGGDMRDWLLKGPNAKMGANGMYNTVAFRQGTPGSSGRNVGLPMPKALANPARRLAPTLSRPGMLHGVQGGQHVTYGQRLHADVFKMSKQAQNILNTLQRPWHATSIYTGMIRQEKKYAKATQSQYTTFRRISKVSRGAKHWFHPGIKARKFASATQKHVGVVADSIVQSVVGS